MKKKLNKFDFVVIAVVVLLIIGAVLKFTVLNNDTEVQSVPITYTVRVSGLRSYTVDALQVGDSMFTGNSCIALGTISDIQSTDAKVLIQDQDGTAVWGNYDGRYDLELTVSADATCSGGVYRVNSQELRVNQEIDLFTKYSSFKGTIIAVTPAE